jgi:hypothetical protein
MESPFPVLKARSPCFYSHSMWQPKRRSMLGFFYFERNQSKLKTERALQAIKSGVINPH